MKSGERTPAPEWARAGQLKAPTRPGVVPLGGAPETWLSSGNTRTHPGHLTREGSCLGHLSSSWLQRRLRKQVPGNTEGAGQPGSLTDVRCTEPGNLNRKLVMFHKPETSSAVPDPTWDKLTIPPASKVMSLGLEGLRVRVPGDRRAVRVHLSGGLWGVWWIVEARRPGGWCGSL